MKSSAGTSKPSGIASGGGVTDVVADLAAEMKSPEGRYIVEVEVRVPKSPYTRRAPVILTNPVAVVTLPATDAAACDPSVGLVPHLVAFALDGFAHIVHIEPRDSRLLCTRREEYEPQSPATCASIAPERADRAPGRIVLVGTISGSIEIVNAVNRQLLRTLNSPAGTVNGGSKVTRIEWLTSSEFVSAHADGNLLVWDIEQRDEAPIASSAAEQHVLPRITKNVRIGGRAVNPISKWHLSKASGAAITDMKFSPDGRYLAAVSANGLLRILDFAQDCVVACHRSLFGGFLSVAWSPDRRYVATGGEDDLVSIFEFVPSTGVLMLLLRGEGHRSWVSSLVFDSHHCDATALRLISGSLDCQIALWELNADYLSELSQQQEELVVEVDGDDIGMHVSSGRAETGLMYASPSARQMQQGTVAGSAVCDADVPPAPPRGFVPDIDPIRLCEAHRWPIVCVGCTPFHVYSASSFGDVRFWIRPEVVQADQEKHQTAPLSELLAPSPTSSADASPSPSGDGASGSSSDHRATAPSQPTGQHRDRHKQSHHAAVESPASSPSPSPSSSSASTDRKHAPQHSGGADSGDIFDSDGDDMHASSHGSAPAIPR